jgi:uncharacterized protein YkwD
MLAAAALAATTISLGPAPAQANPREQIVHKINEVRSSSHRRPVSFSRRLSSGAASWARHLVRRSLFEHSYAAISRGEGEIIEWHTGGRARVNRTVVEWWQSIAHRRVMLGRSYRRAGAGRAVGYMGGGLCTIWVVRFAR